MTRSGGASIGGALRQGAARLVRAPAVLAGTILLAAAFTVAPAPSVREALWLHAGDVFSIWLLGFAPLVVDSWNYVAAPLLDGASLVRGLLFWSFVSGGVIDRYARDRPTRGRGFFAACGAHAPAMLRLALLALAVNAAFSLWMFPRVRDGQVLSAAVTLAMFVVSLTLTYAQVRIVVEDRRSALGALLAASRFVRRNPGALVLHALLVAAAAAVKFGLIRLLVNAGSETGAAEVGIVEGLIVGQYVLVLLAWASAAVLFQSRLAHASYTAGPALAWPESPAAEAIANGAQRPTR